MNRGMKTMALAAAICGLTATMPTSASAGFDTDMDWVWDELDTYPCDNKASATAFSPVQGDHGVLLFEDKFPFRFDFDFNDVVTTYNYIYRLNRTGQVVSVRLTLNILALGGDHHSGLGIVLPVPANSIESIIRTVGSTPSNLTTSASDSSATIVISNDLREVFANQVGRINADPDKPRQIGKPIELEITFVNPVSLSVSGAPYDIFIFRTNDPAIEVHMPAFNGTSNIDQTLFNTGDDGSDGVRNFVTTGGIPWALHIPTLIQYPLEGVDIGSLYPNIVPFGASGGATNKDWYVSGIQPQFAYTDSAGLPAPAPVFIGPDHVPADTSCVPAWGINVQWGGCRSVFAYGGKLAPNGDGLTTGYTSGDFPAGPNLGGFDGFVSRYDVNTGNLIWTTQIGSAGEDTGRAMVTDAAGNIYVVGDVSGPIGGQAHAGLSDAFVAKLAPDGSTIWVRLIGSPENDSGYGIDIDSLGNVFVGGYSSGAIAGAMPTGNYPSSFLAKYDSAGTLQWVHQYIADATNPNNYSFTMGVAVDKLSDSVYVTGTERRFNRDANAAGNGYLIKHRGSDGAIQWVHHIGDYGYWHGSADGRFSYGFSVAVDDYDGSAYVTGTWATGSTNSTWGNLNKPTGDETPDAFFMKFAPDGTELWGHSLASGNHGEENAEAVLASGVGGVVYFTGRTNEALPGQVHRGGTDYYLVAYNHDGTLLWMTQDGTSAMDMGHLAASTNATEQAGTVYIIGNSDTAFDQNNPFWQTAFYTHDTADGSSVGSPTVVHELGWGTSGWSACSNTCGAGTMTRSVQCQWTDGTPATNSTECCRTAPVSSATCYGTSSCSYQWIIPAWTSCSTTCGVGQRTRRVHCRDGNGRYADDSFCAHLPKPASGESCGDYSTCTHAWDMKTWSACQIPANQCQGSQARSVICKRSDGSTVNDSGCGGAATKPPVVQACTTTGPSCPASTTSSCRTLKASGVTASGRYDIDPDGPGGNPSLSVYCDMTNHGGGWTNLDFNTNVIYLSGTNWAGSNYIQCGSLTQDATTISCTNPVFNGRSDRPLYQFKCDGSDRSANYLLDEVSAILGHANHDNLGGWVTLTQRNTGSSSVNDDEFCYIGGQIVRWDDPLCSKYNGSGNASCVPDFFTLTR